MFQNISARGITYCSYYVTVHVSNLEHVKVPPDVVRQPNVLIST